MFGETIDYHLLRPLTHARNRASEEELMERALRSDYTLDEARAYLARARSLFFADRLPVGTGLSYLDVGAGMGRLSIGLALGGATDVTGVEMVERNVREATTIARRLDGPTPPRFVHADVHAWETTRKFDVIVVLGAMEHIREPARMLRRIAELLKPDGRAFVSIEPFKSPIGDHMHAFFRVQIPWRGLLFSERAILRLRRENFRPTDPAERYEDIAGGLNRLSFGDYLRHAREAGLEFVFHNFNPQVREQRRLRWLAPANAVLTGLRGVQDYFIVCGYSILALAREGGAGRADRG